ncbi:MAG TPA: hypothetical protein VMT98_13110, partial [Verrucomicrobiae bacterium]|nr:hypothetical protein [Verrucomicrobiae bacterium]
MENPVPHRAGFLNDIGEADGHPRQMKRPPSLAAILAEAMVQCKTRRWAAGLNQLNQRKIKARAAG